MTDDLAGHLRLLRADVEDRSPAEGRPAPAPHPADDPSWSGIEEAPERTRSQVAPRDADGRLRVMDLADYLEQPELLEPPPVVVPFLAWKGRLSLLVADEKSGKSTLVGQAVAAMRSGDAFLGEQVEPGHVLWLALDESRQDAVRRLAAFGACDGVAFEPYDAADVDALPAEDRRVPSAMRLRAILEERAVRLVVVDTLNAYAVQKDPGFEINQAEGWLRLLRELRTHAEATGAAFILIDHANRAAGEAGSGRRYNGSTAKGATVDVIIDFTKVDQDSRKLTLRGRGVHDSLTIDYADGRYIRRGAGGLLSLDEVGDIRAMVRVAVQVLADAGPDGLTATQWMRQYQEDASRAEVPSSQRSFYRSLSSAVKQGFALQQGKRYVVLSLGEQLVA